MELSAIFCDYARAVIDIRQVEGEGDRRNASRNRSNRAGTSLLFSFGQLPPIRILVRRLFAIPRSCVRLPHYIS
jgi:hypothetical protein